MKTIHIGSRYTTSISIYPNLPRDKQNLKFKISISGKMYKTEYPYHTRKTQLYISDNIKLDPLKFDILNISIFQSYIIPYLAGKCRYPSTSIFVEIA